MKDLPSEVQIQSGHRTRLDGREREFLFPLENKWLPGVGPVMAKTLNQAGLARIGQIAEVSPQQLSLFAGKGARQLWEFARGIDDRLVVPETPAAKSWSSQETFTEDVTNEDWVLAKLRSIADRLFCKVRVEGKTVRTIEVRVRYNDFNDCRRSESLEEPTDLETDCYSVISRLLKKGLAATSLPPLGFSEAVRGVWSHFSVRSSASECGF